MQLKRIYVEITNTCNLACSFCIQNQRPARQMRVIEFQHVIEEIKPYTNYLYLHVLGEPLSHPDLKEILCICEQYGMQVTLTTNGTLLKKCEDLLLESKLRQINVSLHSFPEHEQPHYLENVFDVCEKLAKKQIHISYRLWSLHDGKLSQESEQLLHVLTKRYHIKEPEEFERRMRIDVGEYLHLNLETVFQWPSMKNPYVSDDGRCLGMKQMCGILSDGTVIPCCLDSYGDVALGNIFKQSFSTIIESQRAKQIRDGFAKHKVVEDLCKRCSYRLRFSEKRNKQR